MDNKTNQEWIEWEKTATLAYIVDRINVHLNQQKPVLFNPSEDVKDGAAWDAAWQEAWSLLHKGFNHLHQGFQGRPGLLSEAVTKASVRRSSIAAGLRLPVTNYKDGGIKPSFDTGYAEARFYSKALIAAVAKDAEKSQKDLSDTLKNHTLKHDFGMVRAKPAVGLRIVSNQDSVKDYAANRKESLPFHIRQHAGALIHAFVKACEVVKDEIAECPRPEPILGVTPGFA